MATRMSPIPGPSGYVLVPLRESADFTLYRGRKHDDPSPVLAIALSTEQPSPQSIRRLEHEYAFAAELDPTWAAKPLAITRHSGSGWKSDSSFDSPWRCLAQLVSYTDWG